MFESFSKPLLKQLISWFDVKLDLKMPQKFLCSFGDGQYMNPSLNHPPHVCTVLIKVMISFSSTMTSHEYGLGTSLKGEVHK